MKQDQARRTRHGQVRAGHGRLEQLPAASRFLEAQARL